MATSFCTHGTRPSLTSGWQQVEGFLLELLQLSPGWLQTLLHLQLFDGTLMINYKLRLLPAVLEWGRRCPGRQSISLCSQGLADGFMVVPFIISDRQG